MSVKKIEESLDIISSYKNINSIFIDGACKKNNKKGLQIGGWGYVVYLDDEIIKEEYGYERETTNNKMEITALIEALRYVRNSDEDEFVIFTDSMYIMKTLFKSKNIDENNCTIIVDENTSKLYNGWIANWVINGFRNKKNIQLWKKVLFLTKLILNDKKHLHFYHVKAHSDIPGNEYADYLANKAISENYL